MFVTGVVWTTRYSAQSAEATGDGRFTVPVMAVQLNLSQKEKWDPANRRNIYRALLDMTEQGMLDLQNCALEQAVKDGAEASLDMPAWVIWPESSFPISTFYRDATGERFSNQDNVNFLSAEEDYVQALRNGICNFILLTGTDDIYLSDEGRVARAYNCLTVFEGDYSTARPHAKAMLVPFGEYIPMRETFPFLEKSLRGFRRNRHGTELYARVFLQPCSRAHPSRKLRYGGGSSLLSALRMLWEAGCAASSGRSPS